MKQDYGVLRNKNLGFTYNGNWKDDMKCGTGTLDYDDGEKYNGNWKDDQMHGVGIYTFPDGRKYDG